MIRTIASMFLALSFIAGSAGLAAAENDNDRSTYSAKKFYKNADREKGG